jgi:hypothetical protein
MMALVDAEDLAPECPMCLLNDVEIVFWSGAWMQKSDGSWERVLLKPGRQREIQCTCNRCKNEWEEYVIGR